MSIEDDLLDIETITEGDRALSLFTDRYEFTRLFVERLNDDPAPNTILFLYGEGGNGKSLLLKHLRQNVCKRLISKADWAAIKAKPNSALANIMVRLKPQVCHAVPTAFLDFGSKPLGDAQPQDRFFGLLSLRKDLAESAEGNYSLMFRRFDFACIWYLHKKGKSPQEIKAFFPLDQAGNLVSAVIDALTKNPVGTIGKAVLDVFNPDWSQQLMVKMARFGLAKDDIDTIFRLDLDTELIGALPSYLAIDLNETMAKDNAPPRIVLFFDTHEAFWGEHRSEAKANYFFRDEWLRCLLRKLNYDAGIVAVVAGRDQPRWAEAKAVKPNTDIPSHYLDNHRVGNLSAADALAYLQQPAVGIADEALCQSLIAYASVEVGEVHPLHLGLCADVALRAQVQGTPLAVGEFCAVPEFADKSKLLVERLLKYVNSNLRDAIYALSACRTFDFELFNQLGEALKFSPYRADFDTITQFSFVKRLPLPGDDCYRIHGLLQRLFYIDSNYWVANAHIFLEAYYWGKNEFAEAIYHANRQNISRSIDRWGELFEESLKINQLDCCRKLLSIKNYLFISNEFQLGNILSYEAHYYKKIAFYQESAQTYKDSLLYFDRYLERFPSDINALNNKANTLQRQGGLYELKSQNYQACLCYQKSLQLYEIILDVDKASLRALNNKGACLRSLGSVQHELGEIDKAILAYQESLDNLEVRLSIDPNYVDAIHNKGTTYQFLGKLHMKMGDYVKARSSFDLAIENFEKALSIDPVFVFSLLNQANTLDDIATLMMLLSRHEDAIQFSEKALYTYEVALSKTPYDHYLLNNKAASLFTKARAQKKLSMYEQSLNSYLKVINICDEALNYTPKSNFLLNWRGKSYIALGVIRSLLDGKISTEFFLAGISSLSYSLMLTPENLEVKKLIQETQAILLLDGSASTFSERKPNIEG